MQELLIDKVKEFGNYLISKSTTEEKKQEIHKSINNLNCFEIMLFICLFDKKNIDQEINKFVQKFDIENTDEIKNEIKSHLQYFINVQDILTK